MLCPNPGVGWSKKRPDHGVGNTMILVTLTGPVLEEHEVEGQSKAS